jgi:hypothetical protein
MQDHMHFGILQTNSKLNQTTTILLLLKYVYNPPKRFSKFKNYFLAAICSNTLQAWNQIEPMLVLERTKSKLWPSSDALAPPLTPQHQ